MSSTNTTLDRCFRPTRFVVGLACLALSLVASFALTVGHIAKLQLPGCGAGSPCEQLTESAWGKLPLLDWPVSFIGLAYFVALLLAWIAAYRCGSVSAAVKNLVRFGAVVSVMFVIVIFVQGHLCWYCLAMESDHFS